MSEENSIGGVGQTKRVELLELHLLHLEDNRFKVTVKKSPAGKGEVESSLPFIDADDEDCLDTIIKTLEHFSFDSKYFMLEGEQEWMVKERILERNKSRFHHNYLANIGKALYKALFPKNSSVEKLLQDSIRSAESKSAILVVQLQFEEDLEKRWRLADYPWELLHDDRGFLCHHQVEFSRYIIFDSYPFNLPPVKKLNVLLVSSAAFDPEQKLEQLPGNEGDAVRGALEQARDRGDIFLDELEKPTFAKLETYLTQTHEENAPNVLHFDGHGLYAQRCSHCKTINEQPRKALCKKCDASLPEPQGYLLFEDESGKADYISAERLGTLLQKSGLRDGSRRGVVLVVLSACESARATGIGVKSIFNGAAQKLIEHRVPAVVAMQYSVTVGRATKFAKQFYGSLGQKDSLTVAVSLGRAAMDVEGNQWYRPVLYLRWQDNEGGQLFASAIAPQKIPENVSFMTRVQNFVGRDRKMYEIHKKLQETERVAVVGMGGVGKTELALQYAYNHLKQETYPGGVCWLPTRGVDVGFKIIEFAREELNLNLPEDSSLNPVRYCWRNWQPPAGEVLVIFDDVADDKEIEDFLPPAESRFKVLITTRQQYLGQSFQKLELEVLEEGAALELLVFFVGEGRIQREAEEAKALCADLGFLPLGLELVARYLQRKPDLSLATTRQRLESKRLEHQSLGGVAAAFELSWEELDEETQELGRLLSLFAPAAIPWSLVVSCLPGVDEEDLEDWQSSLAGASLLQRVEEGSYQLHPLIREFFRGKLSESNQVEEMKRGVCRVVVAVAKEIPQTPTRKQILEFEPAIPHLAEMADNLTDWLTDDDLIWPFVGLGRFYEGQGFYGQAKPWREQCLENAQKRLESAHPYIATSLNNLAELYESQGRYAEAEPLLVEALEMTKQLLEPAHPDIAIAFGLNNLAGLYHSQGRYAEAEPLLVEALEMTKQLLGSAHPDIATSLNNLAHLYHSQGRYAEAEPLLVEALEMRKQLLGSVHPDIAGSLNSLAALYCSQGRYTEAEPLLVEALEMTKQLLGSAHPDIAGSLNSLATLYHSQGRYAEAEPLLVEALEMRKQLLGSAHPDIAGSLNSLAALYCSQGRYTEAEPLLVEALEMRKQLLGATHPDIATSLNNLAALYDSQGRCAQAEPLLVEALEMTKQLLGTAHPLIGTSLNNLAALYEFQGRYTEAEPLYKEALEMTKQLLGSAHPEIATSLNNLALLYKSQGRYAEAEPLLIEALEMTKQLLGSPHPDTASSLNNLAHLYYSQGRYAEAEPLYLEALEMRKQLLGATHPDIAISLNNLAGLYRSQGRYVEAEPLYKEALEMRKQLLGLAHPSIATSLNNLAVFYKSQGRYAEAEPLYKEALEMRKQLLGFAHPDIAHSLNNLAGFYDSQERYTEAEPLYLEAVTMFVSQLGKDHLNTQAVWRNYLIFLQQVVNENRQGELSDERSLQIISQMESEE